MNAMNTNDSNIAQEVALAASRCQEQRTGRLPSSVTVVFGEDTLVVTLHDALTPAEKALAANPAGASQVQEFHRQLFADSNDEMRQEIKRITGRQVREAAAEIEPITGTVVHAFTTGTMVQVFLLAAGVRLGAQAVNDSVERIECAEDDGLRIMPDTSVT
jgi:uncharacterized protein YbcI